MIGLLLEKDSSTNILKELFDGVKLSNYDFYYIEDEIYDRNHWDLTDFGIRDFKKDFNEFINEDYYILFLVLQVYKKGVEKEKIDTYEDFLNSKCELIILISDVSDVEMYFKNNDLKDQIINNIKRLNIEYEEKTLENDTRTKMHVN